MTGHLENGCNVVWLCEHSYLSPSGGKRRTVWRFDVYLGADTGLESSKVKVSSLVKTKQNSSPVCHPT